MSTIDLIYIIGGIISAAIAIYDICNKEKQIKVKDLVALVVVAIFAFLVSWVGVICSLLVIYSDVVIINKKEKEVKAQKGE